MIKNLLLTLIITLILNIPKENLNTDTIHSVMSMFQCRRPGLAGKLVVFNIQVIDAMCNSTMGVVLLDSH